MQKFSLLPKWAVNYKRNFLSKDIVAGLTVSVLIVPQGMAYAMIAGLPPVYGLYAALVPTLTYALFGTSRQLAVGPVAMDSLLVAAGLGTLALTGQDSYIAMAIMLAFMTGATQLILGILRMGFLVQYLSKPVISGFTSGAAIIIIFSQIKHILGVDIPQSNQFQKLVVNVLTAIPDTNWVTFIVGIAGIILIVLLKRWRPKLPSILIVVVLGILAVYFFGLWHYGVSIVGEVPRGLPSFKLPDFSWPHARDLFTMAVTLALIGYMEAVSIGKAMEEKSNEETIEPNRELMALGASNLLGSFFQSYSVTGSFSRSAINFGAGAKTPLSLIISVTLVVLTLLFFTPLFYYLPSAVLASIIMVSVVGLINIKYPKVLWKYSRDEFVLLLFTFAITLFLGIKEGILWGVLFSLLLMVYRTSKPHFAVLGRIKGSDYYKNVNRFGDNIEVREDLLIVRFDGQLYFGNKDYFKKQLFKYLEAKGDKVKAVILNAEAINYIDSTATAMLVKTIREIHSKNIDFFIAGAIGPARDIIFNSGIIKELHKEYLFVRITEAVEYYDNPAFISELRMKVAFQNQNYGI